MSIIIHFVYSILLVAVLLVYGPLYIRRMRKGKAYRPDLSKRLGLSLPKPRAKKGCRILIHSVSVGETRAVIPVIKQLKKKCPGLEIYLTTTTGTGQKAAEQMGVDLDRILYFPIDLGFISASFLRRIQPDCICLTETEIWPNFMQSASKYKIPLILINGRISDQSYRNYRIIKPFLKYLLHKFHTLCMQSALDSRRIIALGAGPERVKVTGNIKFDLGHLSMEDIRDGLMRKKLGLRVEQPVLVAGSTHPGEESLIVDAFKRLLSTYPDLVLILAPRHVERSKKISQMIKEAGIRSILWSGLAEEAGIKGGEILQIDVIGVLARIYSLATIVIMGGSFIPHGGQNPLEPAFFGKPILFGPHMENFRAITAMLMDANAAIMTEEKNLLQILTNLLADRGKREKMGQAAEHVIQKNQGSASRTCDEILKIVKGNKCRHP